MCRDNLPRPPVSADSGGSSTHRYSPWGSRTGLNAVLAWGGTKGNSYPFEDGSFQTLSDKGRGYIDLSRDGRLLLAGRQGDHEEAVLYDLEAGTSLQLDSHGPVFAGVLDATGKIAVMLPSRVSSVQFAKVGLVNGGPAHLFVDQDDFLGLAISPDGKWYATIPGRDNMIRLKPIPDLSQPPLHTLPHDQLIAKLKTLTNLRVVRDEESSTGWEFEVGPFPGWETVPTW